MKLTKLTVQNFKGLRNVQIDFNDGFNVIVGRNSSGKTSLIESINWLLNPFAGNIVNRSIPYKFLPNENKRIFVEGEFKLTSEEIEDIISILSKSVTYELLEKIIFKFAKIALPDKKTNLGVQNTFSISEPKIDINNQQIFQQLNNLLVQRVSSSSLIYYKSNNLEDNDMQFIRNDLQFIPTAQLDNLNINQPLQLSAYLRSSILKLKDEFPTKFDILKNSIVNSQDFIDDFNVFFNIKTGRAEVNIKYKGDDYDRPLNNEGQGIQEFVYLITLITLFPEKILLLDEGLVHMHRSLLKKFLTMLDERTYQIILSSHMGEIIQSLDYSSLIFCKNSDGVVTAINVNKAENINSIFEELGY